MDAEDLIRKGVRVQKKGNYEEAIKLYTRAIDKNDRLQLAYYNRGICFIEIKEYFKSLADFNALVKLIAPGDGYFIVHKNSDLPFLGPEAQTQVPYDDALYMRAQANWYVDSFRIAYNDFQQLLQRNYKEKVFCLLWQAAIWSRSNKVDSACNFSRKAKDIAMTDNEIQEAEKAITIYCGKKQ
jgi:tetratricopeptide (TPR) repeat protein